MPSMGKGREERKGVESLTRTGEFILIQNAQGLKANVKSPQSSVKFKKKKNSAFCIFHMKFLRVEDSL